MSASPGKLMGLNKGRIKKGYDGDIVLIDLDKKINRTESFIWGRILLQWSRSIWEIIATIRRGQVKYNGGVNIDNR